MIAPASIEQIKARTDIIDVIGEYIKLKKRGTNYIGNCPFHHEKTPSFTISPAKEIYKCFGCGKSGNTITFLMEHDKLSYVEALKWLAKRYNIEVEETQLTPEQQQLQQDSDSLFIINTFAQKFFETQLHETQQGQSIALSYLHQRGFRDNIISKFHIGYNPSEKNTLATELIKNQFNQNLLLKTGLVTNKYGTELVDNYRGRIIFPIHNMQGKVLGFGARVIGKVDNAPKYINTPENDIYVKNKIVYGLYFAKQSIDKQNECLLVEGYTDVVSLHQAGIENVVASGGTSLTTEQLRLIKKYTPNLTIIYDGDAAGVKAAMRGLDMAVEEGLNVRLVLIPDNEDPDSYVNKIGTEAFNNFIADNKKDFVIFKLEVLLKDAANDVNKRSLAVNQIAETLSKFTRLEDFTKLQDYTKKCAAILNIDEQGLTNLVQKLQKDKLQKEIKKEYQKTINPSANTNTAPIGMPANEDDFFYYQPPIDEQAQQNNLPAIAPVHDDIIALHEYAERNVLRVLLEYCQKQWTEQSSIADYICKEIDSYGLDVAIYKELYDDFCAKKLSGILPDANYYLHSGNEKFSNLVTNITFTQYELSKRWNEILQEENFTERDLSEADIKSSVAYCQLRKIKNLYHQVETDIVNASNNNYHQEVVNALALKIELKNIERNIALPMGIVIIK